MRPGMVGTAALSSSFLLASDCLDWGKKSDLPLPAGSRQQQIWLGMRYFVALLTVSRMSRVDLPSATQRTTQCTPPARVPPECPQRGSGNGKTYHTQKVHQRGSHNQCRAANGVEKDTKTAQTHLDRRHK